MELFSVPLTVDQLATTIHKYVCPERTKRVSLWVSDVVVARLMSSTQVKKFPDSCFFKAVNLWNSLGANSGTYGRCSSVSQPKFALSVESAVPCAVGHFYGGESHCRRKVFISCSAHKQSCNAPDLEGRPIFQVGHNFEVPRLCLFHACAATHTIVKLKPSVTHISSIKMNGLCLSNNMTGNFLIPPRIWIRQPDKMTTTTTTTTIMII